MKIKKSLKIASIIIGTSMIVYILMLLSFLIALSIGDQKKDYKDIIKEFSNNEKLFLKVVSELSTGDQIFIKRELNGKYYIYNDVEEKIEIDEQNKQYANLISLTKKVKLSKIRKDSYNNVNFVFTSMIGYGQSIMYVRDKKVIDDKTNKINIKDNWYYISTN